MQHIRKLLAPALLLGAVAATPALAQSAVPLQIEVRGGASIPTGDFADGINTGWNLGGAVHYAATPTLSVYLGFQHDEFTLDDTEDTEGVDIGVKDNGVRAGLRANLALAGLGSARPFLEGGVLYNRVSVSGSDGDVSASVDSDWKVGFEVGAGLAFDVAPRISLTPAVRYRSHSVDFSDLADGATGDVTYVAVDLGVSFRL